MVYPGFCFEYKIQRGKQLVRAPDVPVVVLDPKLLDNLNQEQPQLHLHHLLCQTGLRPVTEWQRRERLELVSKPAQFVVQPALRPEFLRVPRNILREGCSDGWQTECEYPWE
ncbi:hypothetical protein NQ318_014529 [Aromia moschata]|uniref:Uncharacterized protein n=1 Tax=Aromia moschata TaxID=1265417 RepID=A0AAV8YME5_9CUCU|nr:hypothetical protein NQ318_014529 [Aromia moschata]